MSFVAARRVSSRRSLGVRPGRPSRSLAPCFHVQHLAAAKQRSYSTVPQDDNVASPMTSFKADRNSFPEGLPDFVDHGNIYNNPAMKRKWRKQQAALPQNIDILRRKKTTQAIKRVEQALARALQAGGQGCF